MIAKETTERAEADYIPDGVSWIRDAVEAFEPDAAAVVTRDGTRITYDQLVVAVGIQLDWHKIAGLEGALGKDGIVSNYRYDLVGLHLARAVVVRRRHRPVHVSVDPGQVRGRAAEDHVPRRRSSAPPRRARPIADRVRIGRREDLRGRALREARCAR